MRLSRPKASWWSAFPMLITYRLSPIPSTIPMRLLSSWLDVKESLDQRGRRSSLEQFVCGLSAQVGVPSSGLVLNLCLAQFLKLSKSPSSPNSCARPPSIRLGRIADYWNGSYSRIVVRVEVWYRCGLFPTALWSVGNLLQVGYPWSEASSEQNIMDEISAVTQYPNKHLCLES